MGYVGQTKAEIMNKMDEKWYGITYPLPQVLQTKWLWRLWSKVMCPHGWHLLDECQSLDDHSLHCDACGLDIPITTDIFELPCVTTTYPKCGEQFTEFYNKELISWSGGMIYSIGNTR